MTPPIVAQAAEYAAIHQAVCRYRKQGLACSTCSDLTERAERIARRYPAASTVTRACGHVVSVIFDHDLQRAATEIEQLVTGDCGPCVKARRQVSRALLWSEVA